MSRQIYNINDIALDARGKFFPCLLDDLPGKYSLSSRRCRYFSLGAWTKSCFVDVVRLYTTLEREDRVVSDHFKRETLVDRVADRLRDDILHGVIPAKQRIFVADIAERFAISHIPIREALRRLEAEGLLKNTPNRGFVTHGIELDDLADLYDLRRTLESEYAARACTRRSVSEMENLRLLHCKLEIAETAADPDAAGMWPIHREFHWAILAPAATSWVQRIFDLTWQSAERYVRLARSAHLDVVEQSVRQHRELVEACQRRDSNELRLLIIKHLRTSEEHLRDGYRAMQTNVSPPKTEDVPDAGLESEKATDISQDSASVKLTAVT
jgi:DNA-binding GntR family transcriptional regulator